MTSAKNEDARIEIDPRAPPISEALDREGKIYCKTGEVRAEPALVETAVGTILADGTKETKNIAKPGDYIVTAPAGERYAVKPETFLARYVRKPGKKDVYIARGHIVAIPNPFGRPISILASWGEMQHAAGDCMIADVYDPATEQRAGEPYLIAGTEFARTYKRVQTRANKAKKQT